MFRQSLPRRPCSSLNVDRLIHIIVGVDPEDFPRVAGFTRVLTRNCGPVQWGEKRVIIFTEYEDTLRYLRGCIEDAITHTDKAEERVAVFHGPTPLEQREAIKLAFNEHPSKDPLRILLCNDAAREGLNLQAHCFNLFHLDVPWNPSRLEQRNGRIDRKLQPSDTVKAYVDRGALRSRHRDTIAGPRIDLDE